jgi:hypothetical protein
MNEDEQRLLRAASEVIMQLLRDREDMLAGFGAVLLDLCQDEFQDGRQTKAEVLFRLQITRDHLAQQSARKGVIFLDSLIQTILTAPPADRQLKLRDAHHAM